MIGLAGGVLGLLLTGVGVASIGLVLPRDIAALARVDVTLLLTTLLVAVVATHAGRALSHFPCLARATGVAAEVATDAHSKVGLRNPT